MRRGAIAVPLAVLIPVGVASAFDGHRVTSGPLVLSIETPPVIEQYDQPIPVRVRLENTGKTPLNGSVEVRDLVDEWRVVGDGRQAFRLDGPRHADLVFRVAVGKGAHSALYPIHVYARFSDGQTERVAHAVAIATTQFRRSDSSLDKPPTLPVLAVPKQGAFPLLRLRACSVAWRYFDQPWAYKPVGWQGSDERCRASFRPGGPVNRGTVKRAIAMHPPWTPRPGTMYVEYRVNLPSTQPLKLTFANAIRDHANTEPPSDGVTFRVWVVDGDQPKRVFERHTDSKTWLAGEVDLSAYAGRTVRLRLESHPGPKRNTTCDQCYWAEPTVLAGAAPETPSDARREASVRGIIQAVGIVAPAGAIPTGAPVPVVKGKIGQTQLGIRDGYAFRLGPAGDVCGIVVEPGQYGLLDGLIGVGYPGGKAVVFEGLRIEVNGEPVGAWSSTVEYKHCETNVRDGKLIVDHQLADRRGPFSLRTALWADRAGLRIRFECVGDPSSGVNASDPRRITDVHLGPASAKAPRVHYGHGYCIVDPGPFRAGFGGHNMSTSHVGFDFETGVSLLQAVDNPPDCLEVRPDERLYALHTHMDGTLTLVPSRRGAFDCAIKYRDLYDKQAAGGVRRLAGRFGYDVWGGSYGSIAEHMARMAQYGCTDAVLTIHNWQRWGYDYRLPDIFPPNPKIGTLDDLRRVGRTCRRNGILWGLHDNYIDFYPDATGYTYDHICFHSGGAPVQAWYNKGREARSYRWRPDRFEPFLQRNIQLIKQSLRPNHYFIDVFTSIGCIDFYDHTGAFHSSLETRRRWGEAFSWIRNALGEDAPTTSEAGHDQLTGHLDGADCQFMTLSQSSKPVRFMISIPCRDWERTSWYDAVLHDKFILHGVGYCSRYRANRSRDRHGIISDDYITAEVLTGHPAMVDVGCWDTGAVRKYWLLHDVGRGLAMRRVRSASFVDDDIHRQRIAWDDGTTAWVNRGRRDWTVNGHVLPRYGYLVEGKGLVSAIERIDGVIVEQTRGPVGMYCNARSFTAATALQVRPTAERVEYIGDNRFRMPIRWDVRQAPPPGLRVFVHFLSPRAEGGEDIAFQGDHTPKQPTETWRGTMRTATKQIIEVPADFGSGKYEATVGLYSEKRGRQMLLGHERGSRRYLLGTLIVEGEAGRITSIRLEPPDPVEDPGEPRGNVEKRPIDFGPLVTDGACRVERIDGGVRVTPLPDIPPFTVRLRPSSFGVAEQVTGATVKVLDASGKTIRTAPSPIADGTIVLKHDGKAFAQEVKWTIPQ